MDVSKVAEVEGVTERAVYDWKSKYEEEGMEGLDAKPSGGGRHPELPEEKLPELEELLLDRV
jgi:transposase